VRFSSHANKLALICVYFVLQTSAFAADADRDGLADDFEQQLLVKFVPTFMLSNAECDAKPAEFAPGILEPRVVARNGTIYGQVFPRRQNLEIHYYHLWSRDCGQLNHALDVEHVSALIDRDTLNALYWYAAAHEDTLCDASSAAAAAVLDAESRGPTVWISEGKHGSFLDPTRCRFGCGGDRCGRSKPMPAEQIINIGERHTPMNGSAWVAARSWTLQAKMTSDFTPGMLAQLQNRDDIVSINVPPPPTKAIILGGNSGLVGLRAGEKASRLGLATGLAATREWLQKFFATQ
jgi:hypothetical protein